MGYRHFKSKEDFETLQEKIQEILYETSGQPETLIRKPVTLTVSLTDRDVRLLDAYGQPDCFDRAMDIFYGDCIRKRLKSLIGSGQYRYERLQEKKKLKAIVMPDPRAALAGAVRRRKYADEIEHPDHEAEMLLKAQQMLVDMKEERGLAYADLVHRPFLHRSLCAAMTPEAWQSIVMAAQDAKELPALYCLFCGFMNKPDMLMCPRCGKG